MERESGSRISKLKNQDPAAQRRIPKLRSHRRTKGRRDREVARPLLSSAGMSYADLLQVEYLEYGASVDLMAKNQLDAAIISAGLGVAAIKRAASEMPIALIPVDVETI